ncbi:hypothetical protein DYB25_007378 [Aphanomyces astaci]|uniref:Nucleolus and neural progenitor protein-like N-terminal domain-containing protein n=2 Tax=Aphanomyces astaci TaxID=112090 RepID=A0A397DJM8_APHAT|nr:hypothetical protein DYB25_007378 [Aphanomyces astaci]RHY57839.1 hypothetical protein DYB34_002567 [Aphanomyces astaci]RHY66505.1 hypothetical protein DYB30_002816 [Aphanomyces astaci]RHY78753.1 hypothetical protein DYB38_010524 [Aphanomyces astaci]RHZ06993.1 hypothetical protein DYB26_002962 [Aphanomyces astaci]
MDMDLNVVKGHVQSCASAVDALLAEVNVLRKIIYKNTSQHRRANYFQYLVKRLHRGMKADKTKHTIKATLHLLDVLQVKDTNMHHVSWKVLGGDCKTNVDTVLRQLLALIDTCVEAMEAEKKAYTALGMQYAMTFFMPFCVVATSLVGRLYTLHQTLLVRFVEAHHAITLAYLAQTILANPLYASTVTAQLASYRLPPQVVAALDDMTSSVEPTTAPLNKENSATSF